tara:strand:+ start:452 stop:703 length:252 start_codon:yes stop_codon:yes gene_type:complete
LLNWRNKLGDYQRYSFVDVYQKTLERSEFTDGELNNRHLIVGSTALGLAVLKGTAMGFATDDNLVIATALADLLPDSGLLTLP